MDVLRNCAECTNKWVRPWFFNNSSSLFNLPLILFFGASFDL